MEQIQSIKLHRLVDEVLHFYGTYTSTGNIDHAIRSRNAIQKIKSMLFNINNDILDKMKLPPQLELTRQTGYYTE